MYVLAIVFDLHLPHSRSLKEKRAVIRPIVTLLRQRYQVAVAEVDHQDQWQRASIGVATVGSSVRQATEVIDEVERFVWSRSDLEVASAERSWMELDRT